MGEIYVHSESAPGTLNYYLGLPTEGDLPPAAIQQFEEMVARVSKQAAQVEKDKAAAAQSAADALASKNAAKTSETNAGKSADDAAASAQAAKISETNAANSKSGAETSAASALASKNDAKTSEANAAASKRAAAQSAVTAKTEADRAAGALASKQDKSEILTDLSNSKDADGVREYLGLKETVNKAASALQDGSWGIGGNGLILKNVDLLSANGVGNVFFVQGGGTDNHFGSYGAGVHLSYGTGGGNTLRLSANLFVDPNGNLSVE